MWIPAVVILSIVMLLPALVIQRRSASRKRAAAQSSLAEADAEFRRRKSNTRSMLQMKTVQKSLAGGAPPTPWMLRKEDWHAMSTIETFFVHAIPTPGDGRAFIQETSGHGGPQLELYVPVLSSRSPVAVLARSWDPATESLVSNLFFFGAVKNRLADVVARTGFELVASSGNEGVTVFRNPRKIFRQRSA
jgi:hypothetical protein